MHPLMSGDLAAGRAQELRAEAERARLAAGARRSRGRIATRMGLRLIRAGVRLAEGPAAGAAVALSDGGARERRSIHLTRSARLKCYLDDSESR